jgi:hypothetical protein
VSANNDKITGYDYYIFWYARSRRIQRSVLDTYSLVCPTISAVTTSEIGEYGACVNYFKETAKVADGLYVTHEETITVGSWSGISDTQKRKDWLYYIEVNAAPG